MTALSVSRYTFKHAVKENYKVKNLRIEREAVLEKPLASLAFLPLRTAPLLCREDLQIIHSYAGSICLIIVENFEEKGSEKSFELLQRAYNHYKIAVSQNPVRIKSARGIAESAFQLEQAFPGLFPEKQNPYNALPFIETLRNLGPNIVSSQLLIARYYDFKGMKQELFRTVEHWVNIFPTAATFLKKEPFYQPWLRQALTNGLDQAIQQGVDPGNACFAMARLLREDGRYPEALEFCARGMKIIAHAATENNHLFFGQLLLENKNAETAAREFKTALSMTANPDKCFKNIYNLFKKTQGVKGFLDFAGTIRDTINRDRIKFPELEILIARARMEMGLYALARAGLETLISEVIDPEAHYLMSMIAEKEEDWDAMEVNMHRAIVLDPDNCRYYDLFARALSRQGKHALADLEKKKARDCIGKKKN